MRRFAWLLLALAAAGRPAAGQTVAPVCQTPDSVAIAGNSRIEPEAIRALSGFVAGRAVDVPRGIRALFDGGEFDDVQVFCETAAGRSTLSVRLHERPLLLRVDITGTSAVSQRAARDRVTLTPGRAFDVASVQTAIVRLDSLYDSRGYYLANIRFDTVGVPGGVNLTLHIDEGRPLAVSLVTIVGNDSLSDKTIVGAMHTRPEGFLWSKRGRFDDLEYAGDLGDRLPSLYGQRGFIDMQILKDTVVIDPDLGKATVQITLSEGRSYRTGSFEISGNRHFSTEELQSFNPFRGGRSQPLMQRVLGVFRRNKIPEGVFSVERWDAARAEIENAYLNEGYLTPQINNPIERTTAPDGTPIVNGRIEINEGLPAIIRRVDIAGNEYTHESCIRRQLSLLPGSTFNKDRLLRSLEQIQNLGFFEAQQPGFQIVPVDSTDVNIVFQVKEKQTGTFNFGASVGQGAGLGGFIGLDQPNMFGRCKKASLQWQFGSLINDFQLSYTDPVIRKTTFSGTINLYHTASRYIVQDFGRQVRSGGSLRIGFPLFGSSYTRGYVSYGGEAVKYGQDSTSLLGQLANQCDNCFRSTAGFELARDTRIGLPFAFSGSNSNASAEFNGGPLGGTAQYQRYTADEKSYAQIGQLGGKTGGQPIIFLVGISARLGAVFGNTGPFFPFQEFSMGGTQQGEPLRGYEEFAITPDGYVSGDVQAQRASFGRAFFSSTAEIGARVSSGLYINGFFDAGNVWRQPRDFNPTHLFRGAGVGVGLVTPLGPLGLDWAYGFDRVNSFGQPAPGWKVHFRLGQFF